MINLEDMKREVESHVDIYCPIVDGYKSALLCENYIIIKQNEEIIKLLKELNNIVKED